MFFETGFAHKYPAERGLKEKLETEYRVIEIPKDDYSLFNDVSYPSETTENSTRVLMPTDARDFSSFVRINRIRENLILPGILLGIRLKKMEDAGVGCPSDRILDRFSYYATEDRGFARYSGIDIRLLPPYDTLGGTFIEALDLISVDLADPALDKIDKNDKEKFMKAVELGVVHVI